MAFWYIADVSAYDDPRRDKLIINLSLMVQYAPTLTLLKPVNIVSDNMCSKTASE